MNMISMQIQILAYLLIGLLLGKKKWITKQTASQLNFLVMNLILPCSIFHAFQTKITPGIIRSCLSIFVIAILIQCAFILIGRLLWKNHQPEKERINLDFCTASNNAGTLGMVIGEAAFGNEGILYTSIYAIPLRICMWAYGIGLYARNKSDSLTTLLKKIFTNPCIIAILLGIPAMMLQSAGHPLPDVLTRIITSIGQCTTVLVMLTIGIILSELSVKELACRTVVLYCILRLILFPAAVCLLLYVLPVAPITLQICVLETAMPAPVTAAMLAQKYKTDEQFAGKLVFLSTMLSMVTLPAWTMLFSMLVR